MAPEVADVSVIIPAYRAAETVGRALASVAAQTLRPRQAVVVDDGSDDATYQVAAAMAGRMNGVVLKVLRQPHRGAGAARNLAIGEATGRYVAFLDADDEWLAEKLERSMPYLEGTANLLVSHSYLWRREGGGDILVDCMRRFRDGDDPYVSLYRYGYIGTCTVVARRQAVLDAGGFDEDLPTAQDFDLWLAMLSKPGSRFEVFPEALSRYHTVPGSITSHTRRRLRCGLAIARRHNPELKARPGWALGSLWFRVAAVHYEAITAFRARGEVAAMLGVSLVLPAKLAAATAVAFPGAAWWLWVVAAMAAYLVQFGDLAGPLLHLLGAT